MFNHLNWTAPSTLGRFAFLFTFLTLFLGMALNNARVESADNIDGSSSTELKAGERQTLTIDGVEFAFRYCPAGTYMIGTPENENGRDPDETLHEVQLSAYWILETEVTQKMWRSAMGNNPSYFKGDDLPVEQVSWNDCQEFIANLNAKDSAPKGWIFSLPTEAEWEVAARAGTQTVFPWGDAWDPSKANGWEGGPLKTVNVGGYPANAWGVFDASGNVWEWTLDAYGEYSDGASIDPLATEGARRVDRGGGWDGGARYCRSGNRGQFEPDDKDYALGFRLALVRASVR